MTQLSDPWPSERPGGIIVWKGGIDPILCEVTYVGTDKEGVRQWEIITDFDPLEDKITVELLPAMTGLIIPWKEEDQLVYYSEHYRRHGR
jgi:hypothetical protein